MTVIVREGVGRWGLGWHQIDVRLTCPGLRGGLHDNVGIHEPVSERVCACVSEECVSCAQSGGTVQLYTYRALSLVWTGGGGVEGAMRASKGAKPSAGGGVGRSERVHIVVPR